jgi:type IV pilus assembly protein PilM
MAHTVVGLDIGTSGVRAAEFRLAARRKPHLRKFATCPLPEGAVSRGVVVDEAAVTEALRSLWSRGKFSTKTVVIGIANEGVLVRQMDLDWMPPADFRKALRYQVAEALPVPVDEANLDYHLLEEIEVAGEVEGQTKRVNRVLLVAAAREVVDGYVMAAQSAGLRVTRADLLPLRAHPRRLAALEPECPGRGHHRHRRRHHLTGRAPRRAARVRPHDSGHRQQHDHQDAAGDVRLDVGGGRA